MGLYIWHGNVMFYCSPEANSYGNQQIKKNTTATLCHCLKNLRRYHVIIDWTAFKTLFKFLIALLKMNIFVQYKTSFVILENVCQ
jgi:hypothetical protein